MDRFLRLCNEVTEGDAQLTWVDDEFLLAHDVSPYTDLPLWIPGEEGEAHGTVQIARAVAEGLRFRPLEDTIKDTQQWARERDPQHEWRAGLSAQREMTLLQEWDRRQSER